MTALTLALLIAPQSIAPAQEPEVKKPGVIVSELLGRYNSAVTIKGGIKFTQSYKGASVVTETTLQFEKPSKLFAKQVRTGEVPWLVTSDGNLFSYSAPPLADVQRTKRLIEPVDQLGKLLTIRDIYGAGLSRILDRSAPLEIAIGRIEDLKLIRNQWASMELLEGGDGKGNRLIVGKWREDAGSTPAGNYEMVITPAGDLIRYTVKEMRGFTGPDGKPMAPDLLVSDWQVALQIDATVDPALFTVVR